MYLQVFVSHINLRGSAKQLSSLLWETEFPEMHWSKSPNHTTVNLPCVLRVTHRYLRQFDEKRSKKWRFSRRVELIVIFMTAVDHPMMIISSIDNKERVGVRSPKSMTPTSFGRLLSPFFMCIAVPY